MIPDGPPVLVVHRWRNCYRVPREHPDPDALGRRLDAALGDGARELLGALTRPFEADPAVVVIRRLDLDLRLRVGDDRERVARRFARGLVGALASALRSPSGSGIAVYPSRAHHLARYLVDRARGEAGRRWRYRRFEGLAALGASAALRSALGDDDLPGADALALLPAGELDEVLGAMTAGDCTRVLDHLARETAAGGDEAAVAAALLHAWCSGGTEAFGAGRPPAALALRLYIAARRGAPECAGEALARLSLACAELAHCLASTPGAQPTVLGGLLAAGEIAGLTRHLGERAPALVPLAGKASQALVETVAHSVAPGAKPAVESRPSRRYSPSGGLLMLLPLLDSLFRTFAPLRDERDDALLRLVLLLACAPPARGLRLFHDGAIREVLGVRGATAPQDLQRWQASLDGRRIGDLARATLAWQQASGIAGDERALLLRAPQPGSPVAVLVDGLGAWRMVRGFRPGRLAGLSREVAERLPATACCLFTDDEFFAALEAGHLDVELQALPGEAPLPTAPGADPFAELLARAPRTGADLACLRLPRELRGPARAARCVDLMGQSLLRAFARRLPGFAPASLPFLQQSFLGRGAAVVIESPGHGRVELDRAPLQVVLDMSGASRATLEPGWLPGTEVALCPAR